MMQGTYVSDEIATGSSTYSNLDKVCPQQVDHDDQHRHIVLVRPALTSCQPVNSQCLG